MEYIFINNKPDIVKHVVECGIQVVMVDSEKMEKLKDKAIKIPLFLIIKFQI